jgi:hypothetical protein
MEELYSIKLKNICNNQYRYLEFIDLDTNSIRKMLLDCSQNNNIQDFFTNSQDFHSYKIYNEKIIDDIKLVLFHRIVARDLKIARWTKDYKLRPNVLIFITYTGILTNTYSLYKKNILTLEEIKKVHNVFSKYKADEDYFQHEDLYFTNRLSCERIIKTIKESDSSYSEKDYCIAEVRPTL